MDHFDVPTTRRIYGELGQIPLVDVDVLGDVHALPFRENAFDFVILNHVIEHVENFVDVLFSLSQIIKPGGHLYLVVPDKRYTFDQYRKVTPYQHFVEEWLSGSAINRQQHYEDWVRCVQGMYFQRINPADALAIAHATADLMQEAYSIHYHVWTAEHFLTCLFQLRHQLGLELELVDFAEPHSNLDNEFIVVLRKSMSGQTTQSADQGVLGYVDSPTPHSVITGIQVVTGWVISTAPTLLSVNLYVDDQPIVSQVQRTICRTDVYAVYPQYRLHNPLSGFQLELNCGRFRPGQHTLTCTVNTAKGEFSLSQWTVEFAR